MKACVHTNKGIPWYREHSGFVWDLKRGYDQSSFSVRFMLIWWGKWSWNNILFDFKERIFVQKVEIVKTCLKTLSFVLS